MPTIKPLFSCPNCGHGIRGKFKYSMQWTISADHEPDAMADDVDEMPRMSVDSPKSGKSVSPTAVPGDEPVRKKVSKKLLGTSAKASPAIRHGAVKETEKNVRETEQKTETKAVKETEQTEKRKSPRNRSPLRRMRQHLKK